MAILNDDPRSHPPTRAGKTVRLPLRLIPAGTRATVLSGPLRATTWLVGASNHSCWLGTFERGKLELLAAALRDGDVVYDIGAHVGLYSLLAAARVGTAGHVYAFEPLPRNLEYLRRHLALNGVDTCTVLEVAVSPTAGTAAFDESVHPAMGHLRADGAGDGRPIDVPTVAIDDLVASRAVRPPDVIKCDIEAASTTPRSGRPPCSPSSGRSPSWPRTKRLSTSVPAVCLTASGSTSIRSTRCRSP